MCFSSVPQDETGLDNEEHLEPGTKRMRLMTEDGTPVDHDDAHIIHQVTGIEVLVYLVLYNVSSMYWTVCLRPKQLFCVQIDNVTLRLAVRRIGDT